jgi:heme A synthase
MYKSGWQSNNTPINDELVKSLNLQLAQKNVLIEQFHRSLAQF